MSETYETPTSRIILLGLALAALVVVGVLTVLKPELEQDPDGSPDTQAETAAETGSGTGSGTEPQAPVAPPAAH